MNTPTHVTMAMALLGRKDAEPNRNKWIIAGALAPDAVMYLLIFGSLALGYSSDTIFNTLYFTPQWQNLIDPLNSFIVLGALGLLAWVRKWQGLLAFSLAAVLHSVVDFFLHREDAHHHFWPLSDYQFISPVSYWERAHYGNIVAPIEWFILVTTLLMSYRYIRAGWPRWLYVAINGGFAVIFAAGLVFIAIKG